MIRKLVLSVAALAVISLSGTASAQHNPSAKADGDMRPYWSQGNRTTATSNQSYRRFSYAPSTTPSVPMASVDSVYQNSPTISAPFMESTPAPVVVAAPSVQSYRRYSYQPSAQGSTPHKPQYSYSKTDPRRYRN